MDGVNFKKTGLFVSVGVISADGYLLFQEFPRLRPAFPFEGGLFLLRLQRPVDSGGLMESSSFLSFSVM
jgi:hypothetical protein